MALFAQVRAGPEGDEHLGTLIRYLEPYASVNTEQLPCQVFVPGPAPGESV
jgi:hypothetical protein